MTLTDAWAAYMAVLTDRAPTTAGSIRAAQPMADREFAERETTPWPSELREFYSLHDGQDQPVDGTAVGTALPELVLLSLDGLVAKHKDCVDPTLQQDRNDLGLDRAATDRQLGAGETAHMFLDAYVPFAEDGGGSVRYIDTRSGENQGCVREFSWETGDEGSALYPSLAVYFDSVRVAVESGSELDGLLPMIEHGTLVWRVRYDDTPAAEETPAPQILQLPFPLVDFLPSQFEPDTDHIDLDVVRQSVLDIARSLHPGAVVAGGEIAFHRLPRRRGINANSFVYIDGELRPFLTVVTGIGDEILAFEHPPEGLAVVTADGTTRV